MATTVLVVEDDLEINELLGEYLGLESIAYVQATTGQAGIHHAITRHPDAIILDLMLPDVDGFEVARKLTTQRATHDIPIIILSCMCQDCDKEKGFAAGALFFMNKPFLPDDLLSTVAHALEWKAMLPTREPIGTILLGGANSIACSQGIHQMTADLFARTDITDASVGQIREAIETLGAWAAQWNSEHPAAHSTLKVDYRVDPASKSVEWKLSEDAPGILADGFFKPAASLSGASSGGGLIGWGASTLLSKPVAPIAPPPKWLQVLAKTGAAKFEKDSKSHIVRFARTSNANPATLSTATVPVVEIDGMRYPTRLRDEALAAKRK